MEMRSNSCTYRCQIFQGTPRDSSYAQHPASIISTSLEVEEERRQCMGGGGGMNPRNGQVNATAARKLHMSRINLYRRLVIHPWQILKIPYAIFRSRLPAAINYLP